MIRRPGIGETVIWLAALVPGILWFFTCTGEPSGRRTQTEQILQDIGQVSGLIGMAMLAIAFVLASRARVLEDMLGGLDKMYQVHHRLGKVAFIVLLVHPIAHALRFVPEQTERAFLFLLPTHRELAVDFGVYAFWGLVLLMVLTLFVSIAYDKWKISHKFLGVILVLGAIHMFTVSNTPGRSVAIIGNPVLLYYMAILTGLAGIAFLYKTVILPLVARRNSYVVTAVERLNNQVLQIELSPRQRRADFVSGQFAFVTFNQRGLASEAHPFTICSVPENKRIILMVKALGDFTRALHQQLRKGAEAWVEGPYGRFDCRSGSAEQVWLGAGVGIAPFLSWARHMAYEKDESRRATLYYCVRGRADAVHFEEFRRIAETVNTLSVELVCSRERGHLRAADLGDLEGRDIFMCGPKRFTSDLRAQFRALGVPDNRIEFEDFEFR